MRILYLQALGYVLLDYAVLLEGPQVDDVLHIQYIGECVCVYKGRYMYEYRCENNIRHKYSRQYT